MTQEELSFDHIPRYCLLCMPRPSHSCSKASYSLPRYLLTAVPPRHTTAEKNPAKTTQITWQTSVTRYTIKGSFQFSDSPHLHIPGTTEGRLKAASRIRNISGFPETSAFSSLPGFRTSLVHKDLGSPQCSMLVALHYVHWMVQYCLQRRRSAQHWKVLCKLPLLPSLTQTVCTLVTGRKSLLGKQGCLSGTLNASFSTLEFPYPIATSRNKLPKLSESPSILRTKEAWVLYTRRPRL